MRARPWASPRRPPRDSAAAASAVDLLTFRHQMKVGVPRETVPGERRVALVPEAAGKLTKAGTEVVVESGAGTGSGHSDEAYRTAGATVADRGAAFGADLVVKVQKPSADEIALLRDGAALIATIQP